MKRTAFVIMPIRSPGTEEHRHFAAIYGDYIRPVLEAASFDVTRADDVARSGAITKDIVERIATADMVVADLTDLNPNVFYELGIRHALKANGTMMIIDDDRTQNIPFDLSAYRVHKYGTASIAAIGPLREAIQGAVSASETDRDNLEVISENPVHDWLPSLPRDVVRASTGTTEGDQRKQISKLRQELRKYEQRFGKIGANSKSSDIQDRLQILLDRARERKLPADLVKTAYEAAEAQDRVRFLEVLVEITEGSEVILEKRDYMRLSREATILGLPEARSPIMDLARSIYPHDEALLKLQLGQLAHSNLAADRQRARDEYAKILGISFEGSQISVADLPLDDDALGPMLDAYHADNLHEQALDIARIVVKRNPNSDTAMRNYARARDRVGLPSDDFYLRAALMRGAGSQSVVWAGNRLHNSGRIDAALEMYLLACTMDPSEARIWIHVVDELADTIQLGESHKGAVSMDDVLTVCTCAAVACPDISTTDVDDLTRHLREVGRLDLLTQASAGRLVLPVFENLGSEIDIRLGAGRKSIAEFLLSLWATSLTTDRSFLDSEVEVE